MPGRSMAEGTPAVEDYTGHELDAEANSSAVHTGMHYAGARYYMSALGRWNGVDPLADQYPAWSPYSYGANNPLVYVDPDGKEIRIHYEDENGDTQSIQYTAGMEYDGDNVFVGQMVGHLNAIAGTDAGGTVLGDLVASEDVFNVLNQESFLGEKGAAFKPNSAGGGDILAGALEGMSSLNALESFAHEAFTGYQHMNGVNPRTVNAEVQAYLFDEAVMGYPISSLPGQDPVFTNYHDQAMKDLLQFGYSYSSYSSAVHSFKKGSSKNLPKPKYPQGPYHDYPVRSPYNDRVLVAPFLPIPGVGLR